MRRAGARLALCLIILGAAGEARAWDPLELYGFTARGTGLAGALTAGADDVSAAFYNPAGVALAREAQVALGWSYARLAVTLDGKDAQLLDPHGASIGVALPWQLGEVTAAFGLGLYLPDQFVVRLQMVPQSEKHFGLLDNNAHRLVANAMAAVRWRAVALGAGASFLADAAGRGITFDVGLSGGEKVGRAALDYGLPTRAAPMVGLLVTPSERLRLGFSYRGELDLRMALDILANVDVAGVVTGDAIISLRAVNFFTPAKLAFGARLLLGSDLALMADLVYFRWSAMNGGTPDLQVAVHLGVSPPLVSALFPPDGYQDTLSERVGAEYTRRLGARARLRLRGGLAFEPSPVPDQRGLTSVADNDRVVVGLGAGVDLMDQSGILRHPLSLEAGFQYQHLLERTTLKADVALGPGFTSGGDIFALGLTATGRF
ncbi:MAG TPA: outer membrane protein transport protein [Polyangia bacterium]